MITSSEDWVAFVTELFSEKLSNQIPEAKFTSEVQKQSILFTIILNLNDDFQIRSSGELVDTYFRNEFINTQIAQYPEEDLDEIFSDILSWVHKFYLGEIEVNEYRTRVLKKREMVFNDANSGESLYFSHHAK